MLVFVLLFVISQAQRCVLYDNDATDFYQSPKNRNDSSPANACPMFSSTTCCTVSGFNKVSTGDDAIWNVVKSKMSGRSPECTDFLHDLSCAICSPDQGRIFTVYGYETDFTVCPDFAEQLFVKCARARLNDEIVSVKYAHGAEFLHDLLDGVFHISVEEQAACFNPLLPRCEKDDFVGVYSDCKSGNRTAVFYFKNPGSCQGGETLPPPVFDLPCNVACSAGQYLPVGQKTCEKCAPGTLSIGGGYRIETWKEWPKNLGIIRQFCSHRNTHLPMTNCNLWSLQDTMITTGLGVDYAVNVLEITVDLVKAGQVSFRWRVEAEYCSYFDCDGFYFEIDGERKIPFTSVSHWKVSTFPLEAGLHTLTFTYSKDLSVSRGADKAFIEMLEVKGLFWADQECSMCGVGMFSGEGATECTYCEPDTATDTVGTPIACPPCPKNEYSLLGGTTCKQRPICTTSDYSESYTDCEWVGQGWSRTKHYNWTLPHICAATGEVTALPGDEPAVCAKCQPGFHRVSGIGFCVGCPDGEKATPGSTTCESCPPGTYAEKVITASHWDSFPRWKHQLQNGHVVNSAELTQSCEGDGCVSDWRLMDTFIDSGVGHIFPAKPIINFTVDISSLPAVFYLNFSFVCNNSCELTVEDFLQNGTMVATSFVYGDSQKTEAITLEMTILVQGAHSFILSFDGGGNNGGDYGVVRIHSFRVTGARYGSAHECLTCRNGTASIGHQHSCSICEAGTYSNGGASLEQYPCQSCQGNEYSPVPGSTECKACGRGTTVNDNHTDCVTTCMFDASPKTKFDLNPLYIEDMMYGPVSDANQFQYYLSACYPVKPSASPCLNEHGEPVNSLVCQILENTIGVDLGTELSFMPFPEPHEREGFNLTYSGGDKCGNGKERVTTISFFCEPNAGTGHPDVPHGHIHVEFTPCEYEFVWRTSYACPLCTSEDYVEVVSECDPVSQKQTASYVWKDSPKRCVGGETLPGTRLQDCVLSTISCDPGYFVGTAGRCEISPAGTFSLGNGERVIVDQVVPMSFENTCLGQGCSVWSVEKGGSLKSGALTSLLRTSRNFVREGGSFSFEYKYSGGPSSGTSFVFEMDGDTLLKKDGDVIMTNYETFHISSLVKGSHSFAWLFKGGAAASKTERDHLVLVKNITFYKSGYAPTKPIDCPGGFSQKEAGKSYCEQCTINTWAGPGAKKCESCQPRMYSLPGSRVCEPMKACADYVDFEPYFSSCSDGRRTMTWEQLDPPHCFVNSDDNALPPSQTTDCTEHDCPTGYYMDSSSKKCERCTKGAFYKDGACVTATVGHAAVPIVVFFEGYQTSSAFGDGWTTYCSGLCGTPGWRARSGMMDSGFQGAEEVDSVITYTTVFSYDGFISFSYVVNSDDDGLDFFVDGERQPIFRASGKPHRVQLEDVSVPVIAGLHNFTWIYHQTEGSEGSVSVERIVFAGVEGGGTRGVECSAGFFTPVKGSSTCVPCPAGSISTESGQKSCKPCDPNTFQPLSGQTFCTACPKGTSARLPGSTYCSTPCTFTSGENTFDLSPIGSLTLGPIVSPVNPQEEYSLQLCSPLQNSHLCHDAKGNAVVTYVCETDKSTSANEAVSGGNVLEFGMTSQEELKVIYSGGSSKGCDVGQTRTTEVILKCDPRTESVSNVNLLFSDGACQRKFVVSALAGCRSCSSKFDLDVNNGSTNPDYNATVGACKNGVTSVTFFRTKNCNGPEIFSMSGECVESFTIPLAAVAGLAGLLLLLVIGLIFLYVRNRKINQQYQVLMEQTTDKEGNPMFELSQNEGGGTSMLDSTTDFEDTTTTNTL